MNCRPGDLAVIVKSRKPKNIGLIVQVVRSYDGADVFVDKGPAWWVSYAQDLWHCPDEFLRPIRDPGDDAVDEVLQRIGSPNEVTA